MRFVKEHWSCMGMSKYISIEIAYAGYENQMIISLEIAEGSTIKTAIELSGILTLFPEIDLEKQKIGIFSKPKKLLDKVNEGERIEIYRPLIIEPKEARRLKARKK